ncbi:TPA: hypothetical protein EYP84_05315 [Candidatus Bipolaricaulota bacterium]|nr:hypothetical protein [Candidatus Bipolaricaulota bacterium]HIQ00382.1 hypothetical protein [Candidatus Bipolaricaulota bacterium]
MRRTAAVLAVVALLAAPALSQGKLGVGGSFWMGTPVIDAFVEVSFSEITAMRFNAGTMFSAGGFSAFTVDATFLITVELDAFQPYFGAGGGAYIETGGGIAAGLFTVNALAGLSLPISEAAGVYIQARFFGFQSGGTFVGYIMPGAGLYINF